MADSSLPAAYVAFKEQYGAQLERAKPFFERNTSFETSEKLIKVKNLQNKIKQVSKGKVAFGFSLQMKHTVRKCLKDGKMPHKKLNYPAYVTEEEMMIIALASYGYMRYTLPRKQDPSVEAFLEKHGPFEISYCLPIIRDLVPDIPDPLTVEERKQKKK